MVLEHGCNFIKYLYSLIERKNTASVIVLRVEVNIELRHKHGGNNSGKTINANVFEQASLDPSLKGNGVNMAWRKSLFHRYR